MSASPVTRSAITLLHAAAGPLRAAELNILLTSVVDPNVLNFSSPAANFSQNVNGRLASTFPDHVRWMKPRILSLRAIP